MSSFVIGNEEDILCFPYNAEIGEDGLHDRLYDADDWRENFGLFIGNGVFPNPSNQLRVEAAGEMVLTLRRGNAWLRGGSFVSRADFDFAVQPPHLTLGRRDVVILRHDIIARKTMPHYVAGMPSSVPQLPPLMRTDDVFELRLCEITINPNAQAITQSNILDTRPNGEVCGFVSGLVDTVDTTELLMQYETFLNEQITEWNRIRNTQEASWQGWHEQTAINWAAWKGLTAEEWEHWTLLVNKLFGSMETRNFNLINHNFDDLSVNRGCEIIVKELENGDVLEIKTVMATGQAIAERHTEFKSEGLSEGIEGQITETITHYPWEREVAGNPVTSREHKITKVTVFEVDKIRTVIL